jgi:hypothetical protein
MLRKVLNMRRGRGAAVGRAAVAAATDLAAVVAVAGARRGFATMNLLLYSPIECMGMGLAVTLESWARWPLR